MEDQLKSLKRKYNKAIKENKEIFIFQDKEVLVSYAKYLIEYLDNLQKQLKTRHKN